jgi:hypothetical protein
MKGGLLYHRSEGRRPHFLYGSKEQLLVAPHPLDPLQNSFFEEYHPLDGHLTVPSDREKIVQLIKDLEPYMKRVGGIYGGKERWEDAWKGEIHIFSWKYV